MFIKIGTKALFTTLICLSVLKMSGCSPGEETSEPEQETVVEVLEEKKEMGMKDIQVHIPKTGRTGFLNYQITISTGNMEGTLKYLDSGKRFHGKDTAAREYFCSEEEILYAEKTEWKKEKIPYENIWNLVYENDCELIEEITIDGNECYHLKLSENEKEFSCIKALLYSLGFQDPFVGNASYDFYVRKDSFEILRMDVYAPFLADVNEKSASGIYEISFFVEEAGELNIEIPNIKTKEELIEEKPEHETGKVLYGNNLYQNPLFDLQVYGNDLLWFDQEQTENLIRQYKENQNGYQEEAYAQGDGILLNISSKQTEIMDVRELLDKYLSESNGADQKDTGELQVGDTIFLSSYSKINDTKTKTYAAKVDDLVLFLTLYYQDKSSVALFEKSLFTMSDNPLWKPEDWILAEKYQFTTPENYTISKTESSGLYLCMESSKEIINLFDISGSQVETELTRETENNGNIIREVIVQEQTPITETDNMTYLIVHNVEASYEYYTFIGLIQKDTDIIKLYSVKTTLETDLKSVYKNILEQMTVLETASLEETIEISENQEE